MSLQDHFQNLEVPVTLDEKLWKSKRIVLNSVKYAAGDFFILVLLHGEQIPLFERITHPDNKLAQQMRARDHDQNPVSLAEAR